MTADYICHRTRVPLTVNGNLNESAWLKARRSPRFVDMVTGDPAFFDTRAAALWDDENLYIGFWVEEPFVEAHLTERDSLIFMENDVEVFIDGGDCYYEFEINALNTVCKRTPRLKAGALSLNPKVRDHWQVYNCPVSPKADTLCTRSISTRR